MNIFCCDGSAGSHRIRYSCLQGDAGVIFNGDIISIPYKIKNLQKSAQAVVPQASVLSVLSRKLK